MPDNFCCVFVDIYNFLKQGLLFCCGGAIAGWVACVSDMRALGSWAVANREVVVSGLIFISLLLVIFGI